MSMEFPKPKNVYLKAQQFQDNPITVTYKSWEKKANEDRKDSSGRVLKTWKDGLDFILKYSYPEFAKDKAGEVINGKDGQALKNRNYDPQYPHGYSVLYHFEEGSLESGSLPLFNAFCMLQPKPGERITLVRTGVENVDKKWHVKRELDNRIISGELPTINFDSPEFSPSRKLYNSSFLLKTLRVILAL